MIHGNHQLSGGEAWETLAEAHGEGKWTQRLQSLPGIVWRLDHLAGK